MDLDQKLPIAWCACCLQAEVSSLLALMRDGGYELPFTLTNLANHLECVTVIEREGKVGGGSLAWRRDLGMDPWDCMCCPGALTTWVPKHQAGAGTHSS